MANLKNNMKKTIQFRQLVTESLGVSDSVSASVEKKEGSCEKGLVP